MVSLQTLFEKSRSIFNQIENGNNVDIGESISILTQAIEAVEANKLFSKNETIDDIPTQYLKVLYFVYVYLFKL